MADRHAESQLPASAMNPSSTSQTQACLANIKRHDAAIKAFITVTEDLALSQARAADAAAAEGRWLGILHGLPVAIKDNIETAGVRTTSGSLLYEDFVPAEDAEVVRRLRASGAVIIGKTALQELAFGVRCVNPISGQCHNPWDLKHIPGGSSGGSGAAVAADMCTAALGTDTGGSVRVPASMNGVAGLRPTHGGISLRGVTVLSASHDTVGPIARRVEDLARLFLALAGYDPLDPTSEDRPVQNFLGALDRGIEKVRIGIPNNYYFEEVDPEVAAAVQAGARVFESLGADLTEVQVPGVEQVHRWASAVFFADTCAVFRENLAQSPELFGKQTYERMTSGRDRTAADYAEWMRGKERWKRTLKELFERVDLLLVPTTPGPPPPVEDDRHLIEVSRYVTRFTYPGPFGGVPGLSLPCGFTSKGLPAGLMLEAAWWGEPLLLRAGYAYQSVTDWHLRRPPLLSR